MLPVGVHELPDSCLARSHVRAWVRTLPEGVRTGVRDAEVWGERRPRCGGMGRVRILVLPVPGEDVV